MLKRVECSTAYGLSHYIWKSDLLFWQLHMYLGAHLQGFLFLEIRIWDDWGSWITDPNSIICSLLSSSSLGIGRWSNNMQSRAKRVRGRVTLGEMVKTGDISHAYYLCSCFSRSLFIPSCQFMEGGCFQTIGML